MSTPYKPFAKRFPEAAYWLKLGLHPKVAKALVNAGCRNLSDLEVRTREELLAVPGFGKGTLALCERLVGSPFPSRIAELEEHGIPPILARALARAGFDSLAKVDRLTRERLRRSAYFLDLPAMLDLERTLPVSLLRIHDLLGLLTADDRPALSLILLRFSALDPRDWRRAEHAAPWLKDIPHAARALQHLGSQGWLLVGCGHREQGLVLWRSVRRGRGILVNRYDLKGCRAPSRNIPASPDVMPGEGGNSDARER